jgi:pimeloyl-ACP methyl ester carboxylesterase
MRNESIRYLIVPGWQGSPEDHWQSHWQNSLPNSARVEQADWLTPRREDWVAALAEAIAADSTPVILIAHSLGCITVAHWAATAPVQFLRQVRGALLVAPADVERPACAPALRNFAPIPTICCHSPARWSAPITTAPSARRALWNWRATGAPRRESWPVPGTSTSSPVTSVGSRVLLISIACKTAWNITPCAALEPFIF